MKDLISRQAAIDVLDGGAELLKRVLDDTDIVGSEREKFAWGLGLLESFIEDMKELPSADPEQHGRIFQEIVVEYPSISTYPEHEGKPYFSIKYVEDGQCHIGYGTYKPEVLSEYMKKYFISSAEPEIIRCKDCKYYLSGSDGAPFCFKHDDDVLWQDDDFCSFAERRTDE